MADIEAALEKEAEEIRRRIAPALAAIKQDEQRLARVMAALEVLRGEVAVASGSRRSSATTNRARRNSAGGIDEQAVVAFVRANQPVAARDIGNEIGITGNRLSVKLGRMVSAGLLTKTGERRGTRYSVA
jgi:hypothetical protein